MENCITRNEKVMNERKTYVGLAKLSSTYVGKQRGPEWAPKP